CGAAPRRAPREKATAHKESRIIKLGLHSGCNLPRLISYVGSLLTWADAGRMFGWTTTRADAYAVHCVCAFVLLAILIALPAGRLSGAGSAAPQSTTGSSPGTAPEL